MDLRSAVIVWCRERVYLPRPTILSLPVILDDFPYSFFNVSVAILLTIGYSKPKDSKKTWMAKDVICISLKGLDALIYIHL